MEKSHKDHLCSLLHHLSALFFLLLCITTETFFLLFNYHPICYLLPISLGLWFYRFLSGPLPTYILDFSCLTPPKSLRAPLSAFHEHLWLVKLFHEESIQFMMEFLTSSGIGNESCLPPSLHLLPPSSTHEDAIREAHILFFPTLNELFAKTKVLPREIDLLVVNCSGFSPCPSLSSIIVNHYDMRSDVKSYNISGMGCGAGVIGVDVAKRFIEKRRARSYALVVSAEILSVGWYRGNDPRKLILNCLFRMGCGAVLLTNQAKANTTCQPKYRLRHLLRTQHTFDDHAYHSASQKEDHEGITGFSIDRPFAKVVAELLQSHLKHLGSVILPWEEKFRYVMYIICHNCKEYVPDFKKAVNHLCFPSSGMQVIKRVGKALGFDEEDLEAVLANFHRFGNQSSASVWYQMSYMEVKGKVRKGDRILHLGIGSGPKCNNLVLECVRDFSADDQKFGPWVRDDRMERYLLWWGSTQKSE